LTLADLDAAFNRTGILPPNLEWRRLDPGSYALRVPGMAQEIRVTTQAEVFDDHFESHEFLSPGAALFEKLVADSVAKVENPNSTGEGKIWMIENVDLRSCRFLAWSDNKWTFCNSLADLLAATDDDSAPTAFDPAQLMPAEQAHLLA
jgi:hypothetical protein